MTKRSLTAVIPAFARHLAPVQVLILDARKHRGEASRAWQWFATYGELLQDDVTRAGWATDELLVWDRRQGILVGFPNCTQGYLGPDCVDFETFLNSIRDPRALGLGDCALAGMLSIGTRFLAGEERYTCPTHTCEEPQSTTPCSSSLGSSTAVTSGNCGTSELTVATQGDTRLSADERSRLRSTWSRLSESDFDQMGSLCRGSHMDLQGVNFNLDECFEDLSNANTNPFDTYAACMVEAVGGGDPPQIGSQLQGVPMGIKCGLADPAGSGTPQSTQPDNQQNSQQNNQQQNTQQNKQQNNQNNANNQNNQNPPTSGNADPHLGIKSPHRHHEPVSVTDRIGQEAKSKQFFDTAKELIRQLDAEAKQDPRVHQPKGAGSDCVDPGACSNDCTGLGQQISAANACTEDLLDALTTALGLGNKDENLTRRLDIVSNWHPDQAPVEERDLGACLGNNDPARQPAACGLMLCADGLLAMSIGEDCGCGQTSPGFIPQSDLCLMVRCADGNLPGPDCTCQPVETSDPQPFPGPGPLPDLTSISDIQTGIGHLGNDSIISGGSEWLPTSSGGLQPGKGF